ncbi:MAG: hypothetical protein GEV04_01595 [Actinophytocola sp.]|nr:hypothetical protein [Actinophytocola sp.]
MTRTFDALGFDPAPGEFGRVDARAERYQRVSDQLRFARDAITSIVNQTGIWEGEASEAFARRVGDLPEYFDAATRSMSRAAAALTDWHAELGELRRRAWELELRARTARDAAEAARNNPAFGLVGQMFTDQEALRAANTALTEARQRLDAAIADLDAVLASAERLKQQHDEVAHRIAGLLDKARDLAPDEPGLLSRCLEAAADALTTAGVAFAEAHIDAARIVGDVIEDNANVIANVSDVLGDMSTFLAAAGDGLNAVPVLGQLGDQALNRLALQLGVAALAGHTVARLAGGADVVPNETIAIDLAGLVTATMPGSGIGSMVVQGGIEGAAGDRAATIYDNLAQYWMPRDLRQGVEYAVGPGGIAVALENAIRDGIGDDDTAQADRDRERAEERVWQ